MLQGLTGEAKLDKAKDIFTLWQSKWDKTYVAMREDNDFRDGKQWSDADRKSLQDQQRPVLTLNVTKNVVDHIVGTYEDNRMEARSVPVGTEDLFATEMLNRLADRAEKDASVHRKQVDSFECAATVGVGYLHLDVEANRGDTDDMRIVVSVVKPFDVVCDPDSVEPDMSDARGVFVSKWLSKGEFRGDYPKFSSNTQITSIFSDSGEAGRAEATEVRGEPNFNEDGPSDHTLGSTVNWYDTTNDKIRVVHFEYWQPVRMSRVVNPLNQNIEIKTEDELAALRAQFDGVDIELEVESTFWDQEIQWMEFTATKTLFDDSSPLPIEDFSIFPTVANREGNTGMPYGIVRNLKDPQREINKRWSQMLHLLVQQGQPGIIAEVGALVNVDDAKIQAKVPGGVILVKKGGLSGGMVQERGVPAFPDAPARIHEMAIGMHSRIGGVNADSLQGPRGVPPAAATAELEHRKSMLSVRKLLMNAQLTQQRLRRAMVQLVVNTFSDAQLTRMLGNTPGLTVVNDTIILQDPQSGQTQQVSIDDLNRLRYDVEMDVFSKGSSHRLMKFQRLMVMTQNGIPIDPEILYESAVNAPDEVMKLTAFAQQLQQASQQAQQQDAQQTAQIEAGRQEVKMLEAQNKVMHNRALEQQSAVDSERTYELGLIEQHVKAAGMDMNTFMSIFQTIAAAVPREPVSAA